MADMRLKVSPEELKQKAAEIEGRIADAQKNWNSLCETVNSSKRYWEGEAADYGRRLLEESEKEVLAAFGRLKGHPSSLLEMAGIYIEAEEKAEELAKSLPENAIL